MHRRVIPLIMFASLVLGSAASTSQADPGTPPTETAVDVTWSAPAPLSSEPTPSISIATPDAPDSVPQPTVPAEPGPSLLPTPSEVVPGATSGEVLAPDSPGDVSPETDVAVSDEQQLKVLSAPLPSMSTHPTVKLGTAVEVGHGWTPGNTIFPGDWDSNGHQDLMLRNTSGDLIFYPATNTTSFNQPRKIGTGWDKAVDILGGVDWTGDNHLDIVARFTNGTLILYTGNSTGTITSSRQIGNGWQSATQLTPLARSSNGHPALLAEQPDGTIKLYPTSGSATFLTPVIIATNHSQLTITTGVGDWDANTYSDITAVDTSGNLRYLAVGPNPTTLTHYKIGNGWNTMTAISSDQYNTTNTGLLALRRDGKLFRYPVTTVVKPTPPLPSMSTHPTVELGTTVEIGHGWTPGNIIFPGDWDSNGHQDLMLRTASGDLMFYPAANTTSFTQPKKIGTGWNEAVDMLGGVDWTGDGHLDIVARFTDGALILYTGNSTGAFTSSRRIGHGWQSFTKVTPLARSRNGQPALLAQQPDGTALLYPTAGKTVFLPAVTIATNHDQFTLTTGVGDWDANNYSDITAVDTSGNLRYLAVSPDATSLTHYKIGNGWNDMTVIGSANHNNINTGLLALRRDGKLFRYPVTTVATLNASTSPVTTSDLGASWHPGCPVGASGLTAVSMNHWTFSGGVTRGTIVVRTDLASQTIAVFEAAFEKKFPLAKMRPAADYGGNDVNMMSDDNTSGFNCRQVVGNPYRVSPHSYGYALDINPWKNPYYAAGRWYPTSEYATGRSASIPGMHMSTTVFPTEVTRRGGHWGVCYSDYHHFELGRPRC